MRHSLLILLALLVVTWLEFEVYPGHTYLQGETQLLVPMLERLDTPGFLSRDLVASNPAFAYTVYDEVTQFLHAQAHLTFEQALIRQQVFFRFAGLLGVFLLARALKVSSGSAVVLSAAVNAITLLPSVHTFVTAPEATPAAFAFPLVLLASGLLMHRMPLLASLAGGTAILFDPVTASGFWLIVIAMWLAEPALRKLLRPAWPVLLVFILLLGNLVQLQAGLGSGQDLTGRMSEGMIHLTQIRTPWTWVDTSLRYAIWSYLALLVAGVWALASIWKFADRLTRWMLLGLAATGFLGVGVALVLLAGHYQLAVSMPPARNLAFTVAISATLFGAASFHYGQQKRWRVSLCWGVLLLATLVNSQVLDLLHLETGVVERRQESGQAVAQLATWAETTWGSSMFQFPDAGEHTEPGVFRALSKRSLWADWQSGLICDVSDQAGQEWWSRWQTNMTSRYSTASLMNMLPQPIDYYVLRHEHELPGVKPVFVNSEYVVYDAQDLREAKRAAITR